MNVASEQDGLATADVCVVGSGPVGMAHALRLANHGLRVTVLDGGGPGVTAPGAEFHCGEVVSAAASADRKDQTLVRDGTLYVEHNYLAKTRYRGPSGSGWQWGVQPRKGDVQSIRLVSGSARDFDAHPELDIPGWETPAAEIISRYDDALTFFGLEGQSFCAESYQGTTESLEFDERFPSNVFHFGQARMIRHERLEDMKRHPLITLTEGMNVVRMKTNADRDRVVGLVVSDMAGKESTVKAARFVFAMGGIENSRQLLLATEDGVLNDEHDVFGRWFMDHPHIRFGFLTPTGPVEDLAFYDFQELNGTPVLRGHELAQDVAKGEHLLRFCLNLVGRHELDATRSGQGLAEAFDAIRSKTPVDLLRALPALLRSPAQTVKLVAALRSGPVHNTAFGGWSDPAARGHPIGALSVEAMFEQRPSPDNRIRLGSKVDRFGRRLPNLQWSWSQVELDSIERSRHMVAEQFRRANVGSYVSVAELGQGPIPRAGSGAHHLGGTRQSESPKDGVVDANNRLHGVSNLTMVGTSVFPTSVGYANPTLTAIADGLRVADHLAATN